MHDGRIYEAAEWIINLISFIRIVLIATMNLAMKRRNVLVAMNADTEKVVQADVKGRTNLMIHKETKTGVKKALRRSREIINARAAHDNRDNWHIRHKPYGGVYEKKGMVN